MDKNEQYLGSPEFRRFLLREFESVATSSTIEEMADFAFGSLGEAIKKFRKYKLTEISNGSPKLT
jgi:hypothetical protein